MDVLELAPVLSIDSATVQDEEGIFFSDFARDPDGNIYLLDGDSVTVYRYDKSGKLLGSFLKKGEGPGEFLGYPRLQLTEDYMWVMGRRKIGKFKKGGDFIEEYKQKSFFSDIRVVDESRFLGTKERFMEDKSGKTMTIKVLGLFTLKNEELKTTFFETPSNGRIFIPVGKRRMSVIPDDGLVPDLKFDYNRVKREVVYADTKFFKVYSGNLSGKAVSDLSLKTDSVPVSMEIKDRIIQSFGKIQEELRKKILDGLPDHFCKIKRIRVLHNNSILVESLSTEAKPVFDLFNEEGKFIRRFRIDPGFKFHSLKFLDNRVGMLEDKEESSVYHEFIIIPRPD